MQSVCLFSEKVGKAGCLKTLWKALATCEDTKIPLYELGSVVGPYPL